MIKEKVILRSEVYNIYSSEQQERMKVYFQLTERIEFANQSISSARISVLGCRKSRAASRSAKEFTTSTRRSSRTAMRGIEKSCSMPR